jgi:hypothetical protein
MEIFRINLINLCVSICLASIANSFLVLTLYHEQAANAPTHTHQMNDGEKFHLYKRRRTTKPKDVRNDHKLIFVKLNYLQPSEEICCVRWMA